jgi:hypothetical protein
MSAIASSALVARVAPAATAVSARKAIGGASQSSRPNVIARAHLSFPFSRVSRARRRRHARALTPAPARFPRCHATLSPPGSARPALFARATARTVTSRRADRLVVRAEDGPEMPEFLKDLMKPPDASIAAPGWLAPVIGLAEEAGEDAPVVGYGIMGATGVFIGLVFAIAGLGAFGFLMTMAGTGYACWQASPYLSEIGSKFDVAPTQPPSADEDEE